MSKTFKLKKIVTLLFILTASSLAAHGSVFTVNSIADTSDASIGDGVCDAGAGVCTLRTALEESNFTDDLSEINFYPCQEIERNPRADKVPLFTN